MSGLDEESRSDGICYPQGWVKEARGVRKVQMNRCRRMGSWSGGRRTDCPISWTSDSTGWVGLGSQMSVMEGRYWFFPGSIVYTTFLRSFDTGTSCHLILVSGLIRAPYKRDRPVNTITSPIRTTEADRPVTRRAKPGGRSRHTTGRNRWMLKRRRLHYLHAFSCTCIGVHKHSGYGGHHRVTCQAFIQATASGGEIRGSRFGKSRDASSTRMSGMPTKVPTYLTARVSAAVEHASFPSPLGLLWCGMQQQPIRQPLVEADAAPKNAPRKTVPRATASLPCNS